MDKKIKVLYIAGTGRNGSTILENILGQLDGFFSVGEVHFIWERGLLQNQRCGCGVPHRECDVWHSIIQQAFGFVSEDQAIKWNNIRQKKTRLRRIFWHISENLAPNDLEQDEYVWVLENLYKSIANFSGCQVIVDSSKHPMYLALLKLIPTFEIYTVHLVRDPRAVSFSWMKPKPSKDPNAPKTMASMQRCKSAIVWLSWNTLIEFFGSKMGNRYIRINYEDFIVRPKQTIRKIQDYLDEGKGRLPFVTNKVVDIKMTHTISGNPSRFNSGKIKLREDIRWLINMKIWDKIFVTILTLPILMYYKYPIIRK